MFSLFNDESNETFPLKTPEDSLGVIALTMHDMYEAPPDLFVAGLAGGSKGVAVFSFARYDPRDSQIRKIPDFVLLLGQILFSILMLCLDFRVRQNDLDQVLLMPFSGEGISTKIRPSCWHFSPP